MPRLVRCSLIQAANVTPVERALDKVKRAMMEKHETYIAQAAHVAQASREADEVLTADLDLDEIKQLRQTWQFFRDRRPETYGDLTKA